MFLFLERLYLSIIIIFVLELFMNKIKEIFIIFLKLRC